MKMVRKNWRARIRPNNMNKDFESTRPIAMPPSRFPRTPPMEEAIQTKDWRLPEDLVEDCGFLLISATIASFATSAIDAPKLLRRRNREKVKTVMLDGEIAMASHDSACNKAANQMRESFRQ